MSLSNGMLGTDAADARERSDPLQRTAFTVSGSGIVARLLIATLLALVIYNFAIDRLFDRLTNAYLHAAVQDDILRDGGLFYEIGSSNTPINRARAANLLLALQPGGNRPELGEDGCVADSDRLAYAAYALAGSSATACTATSPSERGGERTLGTRTLNLVRVMNETVMGPAPNDELTKSIAAGLAGRRLAANRCRQLEGVATVATCLFRAPAGVGQAGEGVEECHCRPAQFNLLDFAPIDGWLIQFLPTVVMPQALSSSDAALVMRSRLSPEYRPSTTPSQSWIPPLATSYRGSEGASTDARLAALVGLHETQTALIGRTNDDRDVQRARLLLSAALGIEQLLMLALFFYIVLLLFNRALTRRRSARATNIVQRAMGAAIDHFLAGQEEKRLARVGDGSTRSTEKKKLTLEELSDIAGDVDGRVRQEVTRRFPFSRGAGAATSSPDKPTRAGSPVFGRFDGTMPALLMKELRDRLAAAHRSINPGAPERLLANLEQSIDQIRRSIALSRWQIRWGIRALPAIGFIGTVRSMMLALGDADSIVRAVGNERRASAIAEVSGTLGIAFSTTFFALLFGLLLSFLDDRQKTQEARHVNEFFRVLSGFIRNLEFIDRRDDAPPAAMDGARQRTKEGIV